MNLEAVRAVVLVAEEGQFQAAAARLGISQQAVSKRIAGLESLLGAALFDRVASGAVLTLDGRTFLPHAQAVLKAAEAAIASVRPECRPLRVDVIGRRTAAAALLRGFHEHAADQPVEMLTLPGAPYTVHALLDGRIDAAFAYLPAPPDPGLRHTFARFEPLELVVGAHHPLASAGTVRPADLAGHRIWIPGIVPGTEWAAYYLEMAAAFGLDIDGDGPNFGVEALLDTVAESPATATLMGRHLRLPWPAEAGLRRIPFADPLPVYPWSLLWPESSHHPGLPRLIDHVRAGFDPGTVPLWLPAHTRRGFQAARPGER
ncbi:LysR family transcriptional regulator [Actinocorallia lasiicapitis]